MTEYRAEFDAVVSFLNGGSLSANEFRVDVSSRDATPDQIGRLFVSSLSLLMVDHVELTNVRVFEEAHKGTSGGPSATTQTAAAHPTGSRLIDLSHTIRSGGVTYPGLPVPEITPHLTREGSRAIYAPGTEFAIDRISMVGNTGTYLDTPFHRYPNGFDLAGLALEKVVDLPTVVARVIGSSQRGVDVAALAALDVAGRTVLLHTGGDADWGTPDYAKDAPYLTEEGAVWLAENRAALVGIDAVNIDNIEGAGDRPAHSILLEAGIPIVEHLTNLGEVPPLGALFTAVPPRVEGFGTFPVRAFVRVDGA
ncbi:MAG TPA: cyclase family protein [Galbitalea sp.]|jgi:kynurenine formamidase|nr:cyclase family protein [Galbitalea sp.]